MDNIIFAIEEKDNGNRYAVKDDALNIASFIKSHDEDMMFINDSGEELFSTKGCYLDHIYPAGLTRQRNLILTVDGIQKGQIEPVEPEYELRNVFTITVTETVQKEIKVCSSTIAEAMSVAKNIYTNGEIDMENYDTASVSYAVKNDFEQIKVLSVSPKSAPECIEILNDNASIADYVEGIPSFSSPFDDPDICVVESQMERMLNDCNRGIKDSQGGLADILMGRFIIARMDKGNLSSLTEEDIQKYTQMFRYPHHFYTNKDGFTTFKVMKPSKGAR